MNKKKKIILIVSCAIAALLLIGGLIWILKPAPSTPEIKNEGVPVDFNAYMYIIDNWQSKENDTVCYYLTLVVYSEDYYDCLTEDDIKYVTNSGYVPLSSAVENTSVTVYPINRDAKKGVCSYVKIKSPRLLDTKKIYAYAEGPIAYQENVNTKEDYKNANGTLDGWRALYISVTTKSFNIDNTESLRSIYEGVIRLSTDNNEQYYYESRTPSPIINENKMLTKIYVDPLKKATLETFMDALINNATFSVINDGVAEKVELDPRLKVIGEIVDGEVLIGFETVDGSSFEDYDGAVPDAIRYESGSKYTFIVKTNE